MNTQAQTTAQSAIETTIDGDNLIFSFADGETLEIDASTLEDSVRRMAVMFGLQRKIINGAAIARDTATGKSATIAEKREAMRAIVEQLQQGQWNRQRGDGTPRDKGGLLLDALCTMQPDKPRDAIRAWLAGLSPDAVKQLRKNPRVQLAIATIKAKDSDASGDELLDGLLG